MTQTPKSLFNSTHTFCCICCIQDIIKHPFQPPIRFQPPPSGVVFSHADQLAVICSTILPYCTFFAPVSPTNSHSPTVSHSTAIAVATIGSSVPEAARPVGRGVLDVRVESHSFPALVEDDTTDTESGDSASLVLSVPVGLTVPWAANKGRNMKARGLSKSHRHCANVQKRRLDNHDILIIVNHISRKVAL